MNNTYFNAFVWANFLFHLTVCLHKTGTIQDFDTIVSSEISLEMESFFLKFLEDMSPFCGATDTPVLDF